MPEATSYIVLLVWYSYRLRRKNKAGQKPLDVLSPQQEAGVWRLDVIVVEPHPRLPTVRQIELEVLDHRTVALCESA